MHSHPPSELAPELYVSARELAGLEGRFDTVLAMHVLEHDDDALGLLRKIASFARPGGHVVIEVPNLDCVWAKPFGKYWDGWYLPYHRQHFTQQTLVRLMERGGLRVQSVHAVTVPTMGRSFANLFGKSNNLFWLLLGAAVHPFQWLGEVLTRRRTAIRVVAIKDLA